MRPVGAKVSSRCHCLVLCTKVSSFQQRLDLVSSLDLLGIYYIYNLYTLFTYITVYRQTIQQKRDVD